MATRDYTIYAGADRVARRRQLRRRERIRAAAAFTAAALALALGAQAIATRGEIVPGVRAGGIDLGGLSRGAAHDRLAAAFASRLQRPLTVVSDGHRFRLVPATLGIGLDADATVDRAFGDGRLAERLLPYMYSASVAPAIVYSAAALPAPLLALERQPRNARAVIVGGGISIVPAVAGLRFDRAAVLARIAEASLAGSNELTLPSTSLAPAITTVAATRAANSLRTLLAAPIALRWHGRRLGVLDRAALAGLVRTVPTGGAYHLRLDGAGLALALRRQVASIERPAQDASWHTDGTRARLVPARDGLGLDAKRTASAVLAAGLSTNRVARVWLHPASATLTTQAAAALGIRTKVAQITTDLGDSSANRIYNVALMAKFLDGQIVKPNAVFDFNDRVGPRTTERGFKEGQAIVGGLLIPSIGGGVCQVATTVYDAAFYGGYPILERRNHDFYISHYAMGMDATVAWGGLDLRFRNDSQYGILIRATSTNSTMTVTFYSTSRGLTVTKQTSTPQSYIDPKPRYLLQAGLTGTASHQLTSGERGFSVTVTRIVSRNGHELRRDTFASGYTADPIVYGVGPKFVPPADGAVEQPPPGFSF